MKSSSELKFDIIVRDVFHSTLKSLGYKKQGNSFYIEMNGIGKIINLQKSRSNSKDDIAFTINIGLFLPEYWQHFYNYHDKPVPDFPTEPDCILRHRIGRLLKSKDTWYHIMENTDIESMKSIQMYNLKSIILPYFNKINSDGDILDAMESNNALALSPIAKLFMLGKMQRVAAFQKESLNLSNTTRNPSMKEIIREVAERFNIEIKEGNE